MTIVIQGQLTTEKVEKAVKEFEKEAKTKNLRRKFWQLNRTGDKTDHQKQSENSEA